MARAQDGDREAYRALLDDIAPGLLRFFRSRVSVAEDARDLLQETLIALHRARHTYDPTRPLEPWLFAIARNVATDHLRRQLGRSTWEVLVDEPPEVEAAAEGAPERQLEQALARLPPTQRQAFEMLKIEGLSVETAAARAGTTAGALRVRAHRAYQALKAMLGGR
jgi:RNA polymerase sigma-70 factor (ECF subfamily)